MIDAAAAGDADLTVERLVSHYAHTAMIVVSELDPDHEPRVLRAAIETAAPRVLDELPALVESRRTAVPARSR